jgi:hypothetical protein
MTDKEALKLALEALELNNAEWKALADYSDSGRWKAEDQSYYKQTEQALIVIKEALAQPTPAAQRTWVGLTAAQRKEIERQSVYVDGAIRMTEAKLKELNHERL